MSSTFILPPLPIAEIHNYARVPGERNAVYQIRTANGLMCTAQLPGSPLWYEVRQGPQGWTFVPDQPPVSWVPKDLVHYNPVGWVSPS